MDNHIQHVWSVICQKGIIDANTNLVSIIEIIEKIDVNIKNKSDNKPSKVIKLPFHLEVISSWRRKIENKVLNGEAKIVIYSPDEKELASVPVKFAIGENVKSSRTIVKINGLPVINSGEYKIEVQQKIGKEHIVVAEIPFDVAINKS